MQHAEKLVAMRKDRLVPTRVHIDLDFPTQVHRHIGFDYDNFEAYIGPEENVKTLDLRCLVGLQVNVSGLDAQRVKAVTEACIKAEAARVIGITHRREGEGEFTKFPVIAVTDTQGHLTWPTT